MALTPNLTISPVVYGKKPVKKAYPKTVAQKNSSTSKTKKRKPSTRR